MGREIPLGDQVLAQQVADAVSLFQISRLCAYRHLHHQRGRGCASAVSHIDQNQRWLRQREQLTQAALRGYTESLRALVSPRAKLEPHTVATGHTF